MCPGMWSGNPAGTDHGQHVDLVETVHLLASSPGQEPPILEDALAGLASFFLESNLYYGIHYDVTGN